MEKVKEKVSLRERFISIREASEKLTNPLQIEDFVVQPVIDASPPKWHLAHTTWFFENFVLKSHLKNYKEFDQSFNFLFNSYYESVGERLLRSNRANLIRPSIQQVLDYRHYVNHQMALLLEENPSEETQQLTELGLQHEQQHQELFITDIKYTFGHNSLFPTYSNELRLNGYETKKDAGYIEVPGGLYEIGFNGSGFSYDNESPFHKYFLNPFSIMTRLVTNGEYLEFVEDGGYNDYRHWLMEGWETVKISGWKAPLYWLEKDGAWYEYTLAGLKNLMPEAPVTHISFYEAVAYARWKGKRLLTEQEWEAAATYLSTNFSKGNFLESANFHPKACHKDSFQMAGDVWEWTYSAYHPYPGYQQGAGALGEYNGKFMINQLVLKGGSCATPKSHIRLTYRNFFHPDKRWQFTGIRLAENI